MLAAHSPDTPESSYTYTRTHTQELDRFISQVLPDRLKALEDWLLRTKVRMKVVVHSGWVVGGWSFVCACVCVWGGACCLWGTPRRGRVDGPQTRRPPRPSLTHQSNNTLSQVQNGGKARWAAGGAAPTIADFVLYDVVEQARTLAGGILAAGGLKCVECDGMGGVVYVFGYMYIRLGGCMYIHAHAPFPSSRGGSPPQSQHAHY